MDYAVELTHNDTGEIITHVALGKVCYGGMSYAFHYNGDLNAGDVTINHFISTFYYFPPYTNRGTCLSVKEAQEIVKTLRLPALSIINSSEIIKGRNLKGRFGFKLECADMDRGDAMRNLFLLRNIAEHPTSVKTYRILRKTCSPRQTLAALSILGVYLNLDGSLRDCVSVSPYYSNKMFGGCHTTLTDVRRFLRNPQDARGRRSGTFRDNLGTGYYMGHDNSQIVGSFTKEDPKNNKGIYHMFKPYAKGVKPILELVELLNLPYTAAK